MKKLLSKIFSVVMIAAMTVAPLSAQEVQKRHVGNPQQPVNMFTQKAFPQKSALKGKPSRDGFAQKLTPASPFETPKTFVTRSSAPLKVNREAAVDMPDINGCLIFADDWTGDGDPFGLYKLPKNGSSPNQLIFLGPDPTYGGVVVDDMYFSATYISFFGMILLDLRSYELETGELLAMYEYGSMDCLGVGGFVYDSTTSSVYGITYNADNTGIQLSKLTITEYSISVERIGEMQGSWMGLSVDSQGQLYAVKYYGQNVSGSFMVNGSTLCKIDKNTAAVTEVGDTGLKPQYISGGCIDPATDRMFFTVNTLDMRSYMTEINLQTGASTILYENAHNEEYMGLYVPAPLTADKAPAECTDVKLNFNEDSLNGNVTLRTPAKCFDGSNGTGRLTVKVFANGTLVAEKQNCGWGENVTLPVELAQAGGGMYNFTVYAVGDAGEGPRTRIKHVWIGADTPEATSATLAYNDGVMNLTWLPVTTSVNGGYIDVDNLTYTVKRQDGTVAAEGLKTTSFSEAVAEPENKIVQYYYTVEAVTGELISTPAQSNVITLGSLIPPYTSNFGQDKFEGWTIIDANNDGKHWFIDGPDARMTWNSAKAMDDWLITPPFKFEKGKAYNLTFGAYVTDTSLPERLEVKMGDAPTVTGMTMDLIPPTDITTSAPTILSAVILPDEDGVYYIGIHGISDADMYDLYVQNITIDEGVTMAAPGECTNLLVTPAPDGSLVANISFNAPTQTMEGDDLSSISKIEILRGEEVIKTFESPATGAALSYDDTLTSPCEVTYSVIAYNQSGPGIRVSASTYVGFDQPTAVEWAKIDSVDADGSITMSWAPVTTDVRGMQYADGSVSYTVVAFINGEIQTLAEGLHATSYTYQASATGSQKFIQLAAYAVYTNMVGLGAVTEMVPVGTPYNGLHESFAEGSLSYIWGITPVQDGTAGLLEDTGKIVAQDGDNGMLAIFGELLDSGATLFSGLVSLEGMDNPALTFYTFDISKTLAHPGPDDYDLNEITVELRTSVGDEFTTVYPATSVKQICTGSLDGWGRVMVDLSAYAGKTIQFQITGITKMYMYTMIDNIRVGSVLQNNLIASRISAPADVRCGAEYDVEVTVSNDGRNDAGEFKVELYADGSLVDTKEKSSLVSGRSAKFTFRRQMSTVATQATSYYAKVVFDADEDTSDNSTATISVAPQQTLLPTVEDLTASRVNNGVSLHWSEPDIEGGVPKQITEDFEDADAFSEEYGDWTFVDVDGAPLGGLKNIGIPCIEPGITTGSFWIWDNEELGLTSNPSFNAYSGTKFLFSMFRNDDGPVDDWAISPELPGVAQNIAFYARSYSANYPEKIAVFTSTGSLDPKDFKLVEGSVVEALSNEWTRFEYSLPAGTKYFAIRSYATGAFMLMVDDVTFTPAGVREDVELAGYNVYRNGVKLNDAPVEETEFIDTTAKDDEAYTYVVTAVYEGKGESGASNEALISPVGIDEISDADIHVTAGKGVINILGAEGCAIAVYSTDGILRHSSIGEETTTVNVAPGIYIVAIDRLTRKVHVR